MGDLLQVFEGITAILPSFIQLTYALSALLGLFLVGNSVRMAMRREQMGVQAGSWASPFVTLVIGICLLAYPAFFAALTATLFPHLGTAGTPSASAVFTYAPESTRVLQDMQARTAVQSIIYIIQFIGLIAVIRGLFIVNAHYNAQGSRPALGAGATHIIGGIAAVNLPFVVGLFEQLATGNSPI